MARFEEAISTVLAHEGGYVDHPSDPGGATNFGISKRSYPGLDIRNLTRAQAEEIYRRDYWRYDGIANQPVATKVFDMAVNMGASRAHKILQSALNGVGEIVVEDGKLGPKTLVASNRVNTGELLEELRARQSLYYAELALRKPVMAKFLLGWLRRAAA